MDSRQQHTTSEIEEAEFGVAGNANMKTQMKKAKNNAGIKADEGDTSVREICCRGEESENKEKEK